jgi:hypothetical protein
MPCCGKHKYVKATIRGAPAAIVPDADIPDHTIRPEEPCAFCAEKHLATAYALSRETGYESVNRASVIGELCLCQWHLWVEHLAVASTIREIRHLVQSRKEVGADKWREAIRMMDEITTAEVAAMERK